MSVSDTESIPTLTPSERPEQQSETTSSAESLRQDVGEPEAPADDSATKSADSISTEDAPPPAETSAQAEPKLIPAQPVALRLRLVDFAGVGIASLPVRIEVNGIGRSCVTNSLGQCPEQSDLLPGSSLEIFIEKDDKQWKQVYAGTVLYGDMDICGVSPSIKIPLRTEPHEGQPVVKQPKPTAVTASATPRPNAPPMGTPKTGGTTPCVTPTPTRNDVGNPVARLRDNFVDWAGRAGVPTLGLWHWNDFKSTSGLTKPLECAPAVLSPGTQKLAVKPAAPARVAVTPKYEQARTASLPSVQLKISSLDQAPPAELTSLLQIMQEQTRWDWKKAPLTQNSELILAGLAQQTLGEPDTKSETESKGACYKSVKIGLKRANYVSAINGDIPAKTAGPWLERQGFAKVTAAHLPDARWAWPGDVIVYRYTDEVEAKNDADREAKLQVAMKKHEKEKALYETQRQKFDQAKADFDASKKVWAKDNPGKPFKDKFTHLAPKAPKVPQIPDVNYGHIDVRSYESYLSDFHPGSNSLPAANKFVVSGVYRKLSDPLPDIRLRAFLKVLREWECHEEADDAKRYFMLGMGLKIDGKRTFSDTSKHPFEGSIHESLKFNPAGAYQIILQTYRGFTANAKGIPKGFSPATQDRIAVAIIEEVKAGKALTAIRKGDIAEGANLLKGQWSSLPGTSETRHETRNGKGYIFTMDDVVQRHSVFMREILERSR